MTFDAATIRRFTADWAAEFPEFDVWRPLRLLRRVGPVLQGIALERSTSTEGYFVTAHVHSLTRASRLVSLTLSHRLCSETGAQERIQISRQPAEIQSAAIRLREQSVLSLDRRPSLGGIVRAYIEYAKAVQRNGVPNAVVELEDCVLIPAVAEMPDVMVEGIRLARELADGWDGSRAPSGLPDTRSWLNDLERRGSDIATLRAVVESQIAKHKLAKIRATLPPFHD
jgi:hypothetical protein